MAIHSTAIIDKTAQIDPTAEIGAYAVVEKNVIIGAGTRLYPHAYISEGTTLGRDCQIHPFAVVGHLPQDLKFTGEPSYTEVGDGTVVREHGTIHRGTIPGSKTVVGKNVYIMSTGHIGHNCVVSDNVIIANGGLLAGHVHVGERTFVSSGAMAHQFVRIGKLVMLGGQTAIGKDVPPFMLVGRPTNVAGPNVIGLRRAGYDDAQRLDLRRAYHILYRSHLHFPQAIQRAAEAVQTDAGREMVAFLQAPTKRGYLAGPRPGRGRPTDEEIS